MKHAKSAFLLLLGLMLLAACGGQVEGPVVQSPELLSTEEPTEIITAVENEPVPNPVVTNIESSEAAEPSANTAVYTHDGCPDEHFLDVQADPNNSAYVAPNLIITCDGETMTIQTNNIPTFEFTAITPGDLLAQEITIAVPINQSLTEIVTDIPLLGTTAVTVSGLVIYGPNEGANLGFGDPYLDEILDFCNGHTGPGGAYHLHAPPTCLFEAYDGQVGLVVGYALDGFPILAPYLCTDQSCNSVYEVESSWVLTNPDTTAAWEMHSYVEAQSELDQCNGMEFDDGSYAYFATNSFPYFMSCYRGEVEIAAGNGGGDGQGPPQGDQQDGGQRGNQGPPNIDFAAAAITLGINEQDLRDALGGPPPDFAAAAATLGITEQELRNALGEP